MTTEPLLLTIEDAAVALSCSPKTIRRLINEADANRKSRWRWGRELIDLAPVGSSRRMVRVNVAAVAPGVQGRGRVMDLIKAQEPIQDYWRSQQLVACCKWLEEHGHPDLATAMRREMGPKALAGGEE